VSLSIEKSLWLSSPEKYSTFKPNTSSFDAYENYRGVSNFAFNKLDEHGVKKLQQSRKRFLTTTLGLRNFL
jgi:hypothetical protein